jgi:hypothetical protein
MVELHLLKKISKALEAEVSKVVDILRLWSQVKKLDYPGGYPAFSVLWFSEKVAWLEKNTTELL